VASREKRRQREDKDDERTKRRGERRSDEGRGLVAEKRGTAF